MQPGPYGAPPTAPAYEPLKPSGWWFAVAGALAIGGIALAVTLGVRAVTTYMDRIDEDFQRVGVPGTGTVELEAGDYSIYHEYFGAYEDRGFAPSVSVSVTDPDGDAVDLDDYSGNIEYSTDDHEGLALYSFTAEESGTYTVSAEGDSASTIAVGEGLGRGLAGGIVLAVISGGGGVLAAIILTIVVAVKRSGARTRRSLAMVRGGWGPPGAPGGPVPPGAAGGPVPPGGWPVGPPPSGGFTPPPGWTPPPAYPQPPPQPAPPPPPAPPPSGEETPAPPAEPPRFE